MWQFEQRSPGPINQKPRTPPRKFGPGQSVVMSPDEPFYDAAGVGRLIEIAVGRKTRAGVVLGADQRISVEEALHAVTLGAAYQYFEEDRKGSISVGKQADLVVLARDPARSAPHEISEIPIHETIARGRTIYRRGS